ncbi:MAG: ribonuclease R [Candidatus Yonathbacteria bacterium]|nr:ribonuclease R [Candidatus Yonathbacteria bacterium]
MLPTPNNKPGFTPDQASQPQSSAINAPLPKEIEGVISVTGKGVGYIPLTPDNKDERVRIETDDLNTALHGDIVNVSVLSRNMRGEVYGSVKSVVTRAKTQFVGTVSHEQGITFVIPDDQRVYRDIVIPESVGAGLADNEKVYVRITEWHDPRSNPVGAVLERIGVKGNNDAEMRAIALEKGIVPDFPPEVEAEAAAIDHTITTEEIAKRRDMRTVTTCTIDPEDAKDFDDALSFQILTSGDIEVGVHIADVAHYVIPGTALDKEAARRGTSVYLVDRTIPMLPEVLSNDLCSLNPNEDKFAFSAVFTFSASALAKGAVEIVDEWFGRTVIHSNKRFSYESAQEVITSGAGDMATELNTLNTIAHILQKNRFAKGAISFEKDEVRFTLDETGKPIGVHVKERLDAHKLIEDFMLLANKRVAEFIGKKDDGLQKTFIYRIHDVPDRDRIKELATFVKTLGYELKSGEEGPTSRDINDLLAQVKGTPEEQLITTAAIRCMAKAVYATGNIGHFGLAFEHYTHFTSPIRRYPDVMVHRLLALYLSGKTVKETDHETYEAMSRYASEMEKHAADAERASIKYKQVEFMLDKVGDEFTGTISGVTKFGIYVEESETRAEGLIHIRDLGDDFYIFDEKNYALVGERNKKRYRLGDPIRFRLVRADLDARTLDMEVVNDAEEMRNER